jgi:hypothetical protein
MRLLSLLTMVTSISIISLQAQKRELIGQNDLAQQYGFSAKLLMEIPMSKAFRPIFNFSISGGVGSNFAVAEVHPSVNVEVLFYNGGLGSAKPRNKTPTFIVDIIAAFTVTGGLKNLAYGSDAYSYVNRNIPLYYFSNFGNPSLQNPFNSSLSLGTNLIWSFDRNKAFQRVGFLNIHVDRFQVSYYNDGGFLMWQLNLGDRRDRFYTGGAVISYHGSPVDPINFAEVAYHKFTGHSRNAFEASNELDLSFVNYKDPRQQFYNRSMLHFSIGNPHDGWGANVRYYNDTVSDFQHVIHKLMYNAFHICHYKSELTIGGQYYNSSSKTNLR